MNFYPDLSNLDLRDEMDALLFGRVDITPIGRPVVLRRISNTFCVCWNQLSGGPDRFCVYCAGEGYLWTETYETMALFRGVAPIYKPGTLATGMFPLNEMGYTDLNKGTGYARYTVWPDYERYTIPTHKSFDKMYELKLNPDGTIQYPEIRSIKWKILNVVPMHGDFGRVEFFELTLDKENI